MSKIDEFKEKFLFIDYIPNECYKQKNNQKENDNMNNIEKELFAEYHKNKENINKSPLGITPKHIYELQRVQDICRALQEYSCYEVSIHNYELMIKWSEELVERLGNLKFELEYENK